MQGEKNVAKLFQYISILLLRSISHIDIGHPSLQKLKKLVSSNNMFLWVMNRVNEKVIFCIIFPFNQKPFFFRLFMTVQYYLLILSIQY